MSAHFPSRNISLLLVSIAALCLGGTRSLANPEAAPDQNGVCFEIRLLSDTQVEGWTPFDQPNGEVLYLSPVVEISNVDVESAWSDISGEEPAVGLLMTEEGARKLAALTRSHRGERLAFVIDGTVVAAPTIVFEITGGRAVLQGASIADRTEDIARGIVAFRDRPGPEACE